MNTVHRVGSALARRLLATARVWRLGPGHMAMLVPVPVSDRGRRAARAVVPAGSIDRPVRRTGVGGRSLRIEGWAMTQAGPCSRVELTINGRPVGRARLGDTRPDAEEAFRWPAARLAGFHLPVDLAELGLLGTVVELAGFGVGLDGVTVTLPPVRVALELGSSEAKTPQEAVDPAVARDSRAFGAPARSTRSAAPVRKGDLQLLVCTHELGYGGAQLFLVELLRRICQLGSVSGLVLSPSDGPTRGALEELGFEVHVTSPFPIGSPEQYESRLVELTGWAAGRHLDVALVNSMVAFPGGDLCARLGLPTVWAIHESYSLQMLWSALGDGLDPAVRERAEAGLRAVSAAAFTCGATRDLYEPYLPGVACVTLPYGVDVDGLSEWHAGFDRTEARRREGISDDATVILCMGTIEPRKAQTQLIHAFARVAEHRPRALLVLVGSRGDEHAEAAHLAADVHGLTDRVRIQPIVADPRPSYAIADLMVSASDLESTPRSILEAMALGLPVLSTNVFGIPELIVHDETGWLCEARDVLALAQALDHVLGLDDLKRRSIARNARLLVDNQYRSEICSREWERLLRETVSSRSTGSAIA